MADAGYSFAPIILIRLAVVPFKALSDLATPQTTAVGREVFARKNQLLSAKTAVEKIILSREHGLPEKHFGEECFRECGFTISERLLMKLRKRRCLESEIFHRRLAKAGELEVTEMLPGPDRLLWQEKDGRRTFALRTQIIPR